MVWYTVVCGSILDDVVSSLSLKKWQFLWQECLTLGHVPTLLLGCKEEHEAKAMADNIFYLQDGQLLVQPLAKETMTEEMAKHEDIQEKNIQEPSGRLFDEKGWDDDETYW